MNSPWWKKAFAFARCGQKQSGNIKSAMIPVKYRGGKDQCLFTSMFKSNYDYFLQLRSLDSAFFTLQVLVHLDNETKRLYLDKASQKPRLCNDVWIKAQVKILHVKSVENASKRPTWKTKEQSFPKYGTLLRKQWVWNEKSLTHLSFLYFSHYDAFALRTRQESLLIPKIEFFIKANIQNWVFYK